MSHITFEMTDTEAIVLEHISYDPLDFIENIVTWQARIAMDELAEMQIQQMIDDPNTATIPCTKDEIVLAACESGCVAPLAKTAIT